MEAAELWDNWEDEHALEKYSHSDLNLAITDDPSMSVYVTLTLQEEDYLKADWEDYIIESVVVFVELLHTSRGDLDIVLTSPSGTVSVLHPGKRPEFQVPSGSNGWELMTVKNWGESPFGEWKLNVTDIRNGSGSGGGCADYYPWRIPLGRFTTDCEALERIDACDDGELVLDNLDQFG